MRKIQKCSEFYCKEYAQQKRLTPIMMQASDNNGAPGGSRTPDHLVRSQVLYPAELQALI